MIGHLLRVLHSNIREAAKRGHPLATLVFPDEKRSPEWRKIELAYVKANPNCKACGSSQHLQVHHKAPFHARPDLELDLTNLIGLCMGDRECHLKIGHGGSFKFFNPSVELDAAACLKVPSAFDQVAHKAFLNRVVNA